ncbi:uncharacterized protein LOC106657111 [Trichogramma pretiosum]|uniref:uncharacterized protein LOC106657111 n=1 Tax=Trichogramma pretiosum TaxID=7493 RepID=UPI0006C93D52|nr:uncharacterized protein LOC106657111 [Trichogramma pretiosum]
MRSIAAIFLVSLTVASCLSENIQLSNEAVNLQSAFGDSITSTLPELKREKRIIPILLGGLSLIFAKDQMEKNTQNEYLRAIEAENEKRRKDLQRLEEVLKSVS